MKTYKIAVLAGDGIGPEIVDGSLLVLDVLQTRFGRFRLEYEFLEAGAGCYQKTGTSVPASTLRAIEAADATFKGPTGLPDVRLPDGTEAGVLGGVLRGGYDLYANLRPIRLFPNTATPLKEKGPDSIDYYFLRENTEGLYVSRGLGVVTSEAVADTLMLTRKGCERIVRLAFELARKKTRGAPEDGKRRVTLVEKSNVLRSFAFFKEIFLQLARDNPDIGAECLYVDAAAAALVNRPEHFNVVVTENMFGDILSDLGGATVGGLGMCPSANIGDLLAYFEPIHGTAPDIAGKGIANPVSQIRAAAMMLDYLTETDAAQMLETAVWQALEKRQFGLTSTGRIDGKMQTAIGAIQSELSQP